jgi:hypothetical protein
MKNIRALSVCNIKPKIIIDHEGLEAIKYIVAIAPLEVQWFHTVTPKKNPENPEEIFLFLSTRLYIPKQNTSSAEVNSTSTMMIDFYHELKKEKTTEETNSILKSMTWNRIDIEPINKTSCTNLLIEKLKLQLSEQEVLWFAFITEGKKTQITNIFTEKQQTSYQKRYSYKAEEYLTKYFDTSEDSIIDLKKKLILVFDLVDCNNVSEIKNHIESTYVF